MKKLEKDVVEEDDMRPQHGFSGGVRGEYYERFRQSSNVVVLDADVPEAFPNSEADTMAAQDVIEQHSKAAAGKASSAPTTSAAGAERGDLVPLHEVGDNGYRLIVRSTFTARNRPAARSR